MNCNMCGTKMDIGWFSETTKEWYKWFRNIDFIMRFTSGITKWGAPVKALRCPACGEIKVYISDKLK